MFLIRTQFLLNFIVIIFVLLISSKSYPQRFNGGITMGISNSQIHLDEQGGYDKHGIIAGAFVNTIISDNITLQAELQYIGKGANYEKKNKKQILRYIEIPFLFHYNFLDKFRAGLGVAPAYLFNDIVKVNREPREENRSVFKSFDKGIMADFEYRLSSHIGARVSYTYSITTFRNDRDMYNNVLSFKLNYTF